MVTILQKSIIDTHKIKRKESKHSTKDSHEITREGNIRRRKERKRTYKTTNKTINNIAVST